MPCGSEKVIKKKENFCKIHGRKGVGHFEVHRDAIGFSCSAYLSNTYSINTCQPYPRGEVSVEGVVKCARITSPAKFFDPYFSLPWSFVGSLRGIFPAPKHSVQ